MWLKGNWIQIGKHGRVAKIREVHVMKCDSETHEWNRLKDKLQAHDTIKPRKETRILVENKTHQSKVRRNEVVMGGMWMQTSSTFWQKRTPTAYKPKFQGQGGIPAIPAPSITWHGWFIYGCWGGTVQLGSWKFLGAEFWKSTLLDNSPFARLLRLAPMLNPSRNTRSQLLTLCCAGRVGGKGISNRTFHQLCWTAMQLADLSFGFKLFLLTRSSHISFVHRRTLFKGLRHYSWTVTGWDMMSQKTIVSPKAGPQSCQDQWWTHSGSCPRHRRRWRSTRAKRSPCSSRRY